MLFECKVLSRRLNFIHVVSKNAGYVRNTGYIVVESIKRYFPHNVKTEIYVNNMYTKLLITNNIQKNIAGAATVIAPTKISETLCFISDSRTQSFPATRN